MSVSLMLHAAAAAAASSAWTIALWIAGGIVTHDRGFPTATVTDVELELTCFGLQTPTILFLFTQVND